MRDEGENLDREDCLQRFRICYCDAGQMIFARLPSGLRLAVPQ
jgi:hypothetical protein